MTALVCDLGGTSCRLGLVNTNGLDANTVRIIGNDTHADFLGLLAAYLADVAASDVGAVVIAVAAPIAGDTINLTNRNWAVSQDNIRRLIGAADIRFINDFEALGHSLLFPDKLHTALVHSTEVMRDGLRLVLGGGTGFNCAVRLESGQVVRCEAGHATFAAETEFDDRLRNRFTLQYGRCSNDRLLSGSGLVAIYQEVCMLAEAPIMHTNSVGVVTAGLGGEDLLALRACEEFCRMLGRAAGDLALVFLPIGGVFLTGGVTRALAPMLRDCAGPFHRAFLAKGRMSGVVSRFSVRLIQDDSAALHGCAGYLKN